MAYKFSFLHIARVGWRLSIPCIAAATIAFLLGWTIPGVIMLGCSVCILFFFRDPERRPPNVPGAVLSPADGRILSTAETVAGEDNPRRACKKVVIFMSVFNVHINRTPVDAMVRDIRYRPGKFFTAFSEKASECNEANFIYLTNGDDEFVMTQIAGIIARRIICPLKINDRLKKGERIGLIGFGSRVELTLPDSAQIRVKDGQRVRAGESIIALMPESSEKK